MKIFEKNIVAGNSLKFEYTPENYTIDNGYTYSIVLNGISSINISTVIDNDVFKVDILPTVTTLWPAGVYDYVVIATNGTEQHTEVSGTVEIELRADLKTNGDRRTHCEKVLADIEIVIEKRAKSDTQSYSIAQRSLSKIPILELIMMRDDYKRQVQKLKNKRPRTVSYMFASY